VLTSTINCSAIASATSATASPFRRGFGARDLAAMMGESPWLMRMRRQLPRITFANYVRPGEPSDIAGIAARMGGILDPGLSWWDVDWLRAIWNGPLLLNYSAKAM
jgi:hypothetical protein